MNLRCYHMMEAERPRQHWCWFGVHFEAVVVVDIWLVVIGMVVGELWASVVAVVVEVVVLAVAAVDILEEDSFVQMKVAWVAVEEEEAV